MVGHCAKFSSSIVTTVQQLEHRDRGYTKIWGQIFALLMLQFLATFEILLSGLSTTRKHHKNFSCNFLGVNLHFDSTISATTIDGGNFFHTLMTCTNRKKVC